jgi:predicted neuraminidase
MAVFALPFKESLRISSPSFAFSDSQAGGRDASKEAPFFQAGLIFNPSVTPSVHSSCLTELPDGGLLAAWFGGTREGAEDVEIYQSTFDPSEQAWSPPRSLIGPKETQKELGRYVRKVGNPVLFTDSRERVWLFYVTVSLGGWSTSHISFITSDDGGRTWSRARRLVTSPFLNISTLVKGTLFEWSDGSIGLPVYHECLGKFGELLRIAPDGRILDKIRLTSGRQGIQPVIMVQDQQNAIALLRNYGHSSRAILTQFTTNAGRRWSALQPTTLPNPNAAVAAIRLSGDLMLLAYNDTTPPPGRRRNLWLAASRDEGQSWEALHALEPTVEPGTDTTQFSYPWMMRASDGTIHVVYTWHRTHIKHAMFNEAWVRSLLLDSDSSLPPAPSEL